MSDFSMYGPAESGGRLFDQDAQASMLRAAQVEQATAGARDINAQAAGREQDLAANQAFAEKMAQMGGTPQQPGQSMASSVEAMSKAAYDSGAFTKGADLASKAATIRAQEASALRSQSLQKKDERDGQIKALEKASSLYDGVDSQESFDRANAQYAFLFGAPSPAAGQPYSKDTVDALSNFGSSAAEKMKAQIAADEAASRQEARKSASDFRDFRKGLLTKNAEISQQREDRLAKVGGKGAPTPSLREQKFAENLIAKDFPDLAAAGGEAEIRPAAFSIAARAKAIQKENPSITVDSAIRQAYGEEKAGGSFKILDSTYKILGVDVPFTGGKKTKYVPGGVAPLPTDRKDIEGKLKDGEQRMSPHGLLTWDAKKQKFVGGQPKKVGSLSSIPEALPDSEPDTDEDD